jgi:hypothetical protein
MRRIMERRELMLSRFKRKKYCLLLTSIFDQLGKTFSELDILPSSSDPSPEQIILKCVQFFCFIVKDTVIKNTNKYT